MKCSHHHHHHPHPPQKQIGSSSCDKSRQFLQVSSFWTIGALFNLFYFGAYFELFIAHLNEVGDPKKEKKCEFYFGIGENQWSKLKGKTNQSSVL
jgi:hypothetical protein